MTPNLTPETDTSFTTNGKVKIQIEIAAATTKIALHSKQIIIDEENVMLENEGNGKKLGKY